MNSSSDPLLPLETVIYRNLIPQLTGLYDLSDTIRKLLSLPYRFGGLNITNPCTHLPSQHPFSCETYSPLIDYYFSDSTGSDISECLGRQHYIKSTVASRYHDSLTATASDHMIHLHNIVLTYAPRKEHQTGTPLSPSSTQYSLDLCTEKGASNWVSALPLSSLVHKSAFRDAIYLRYGWHIPDTLSDCTCGRFSLEHVLSCPAGGFASIRHNDVCDITATQLSEVCTNVEIELHLQQLTGEQ